MSGLSGPSAVLYLKSCKLLLYWSWWCYTSNCSLQCQTLPIASNEEILLLFHILFKQCLYAYKQFEQCKSKKSLNDQLFHLNAHTNGKGEKYQLVHNNGDNTERRIMQESCWLIIVIICKNDCTKSSMHQLVQRICTNKVCFKLPVQCLKQLLTALLNYKSESLLIAFQHVAHTHNQDIQSLMEWSHTHFPLYRWLTLALLNWNVCIQRNCDVKFVCLTISAVKLWSVKIFNPREALHWSVVQQLLGCGPPVLVIKLLQWTMLGTLSCVYT